MPSLRSSCDFESCEARESQNPGFDELGREMDEWIEGSLLTFHRKTSLPLQLCRIPAELPVSAEDERYVG